jgi:hypothetical protein
MTVRMTSLSPGNAMWKRDLVWFDGQIAELAQWCACVLGGLHDQYVRV